MREKIIISIISIFVTISCLVGVGFVMAWSEPTNNPPAGNVAAPINVSSTLQTKAGTLGLNGAVADANIGLNVTGVNYGLVAKNKNNLTEARLGDKSNAGYFNSQADIKPAINVTGKYGGIFSSGTTDYGVWSSGGLYGLYGLDTDGNYGYIGGQGNGLYGSGRDNGVYAVGSKIGVYGSSAKLGMKIENSAKNNFVEAAGTDYAFKAQKDANTNVTLADKMGNGIVAQGSSYAGKFTGKVWVNGNLEVTGQCLGKLCFGDLAENVDVAQNVEDGDIVEMSVVGSVVKTSTPYSKRAIGVISENPSMVLSGKTDKTNKQAPLALAGLVMVKATNANGAMEIGDYITSSNIPGVGMKATKSGYVIGKVLQPFDKTNGSVLILVDLDSVYLESK
ncbi:hypothetical protein HY932_02015 [Candidatus Falkowbacteria bacterium]|nr:hypothetical protein [Candidatus Falkowbacteria bacterium]